MSDVHHEKERKARKAYTCEEAGWRGCRRTAQIKPGDRYVYYSGVYEGEPYSGRSCLRCRRARMRAWDRWRWDHPDEAPPMGELVQWMREMRWERRWARDKAIRDRVARLRAEGHHQLAEGWERERLRG